MSFSGYRVSKVFGATLSSWFARAWVALPLLLAVGCDFPGRPNPADRPVPDEEVVSFDPLYRRNCAGCHGADGRLGPALPLNDPVFLAIVPEAELRRAVAAGRPGTLMPAFAQANGGTLTDAQVDALAAGIKPRWQAATTADTPAAGAIPQYLVSNREAPHSAPGDRERGAEIFSRACAGCHGANGHGEGGIAGAINVIAFLALISDQALRRVIITGRPDLGMPNYAEKEGRPDDFAPLTSDQIEDLVALLAAWRTNSGAVARANEP